MKAFCDKIKDARAESGLSQPQLGEMAGVSTRSIVAYEKEKKAETGNAFKTCKGTGSIGEILSDDSCENPMEDIERDGYIEQARKLYGVRGGNDVDSLLRANSALLPGVSYLKLKRTLF